MILRQACQALVLVAVLHIATAAQVDHMWDLREVDQPGQVTIHNPHASDAEFGTPVRSGDLNGDGLDVFDTKTEVTDVNGDGMNDLLVGAYYADGPAGEDAGKLYAIAGAADVAPEVFSLEPAYPNPFNGRVVVPFRLHHPDAAAVIVFDLAGQRVTRIDAGIQPPGEPVVSWDGGDEAGRAAASGDYLVRFAMAAQPVAVARRVVLLR